MPKNGTNTDFITSVKLVTNDDKECDTSAKTVQGDGWRAGNESWAAIDSFQNLL